MSRPEGPRRSRSTLLRRGVPALVALLLAALLVLVLDLGGDDGERGATAAPATATAPATAPAEDPSGAGEAEATPTEPPAPATELLAAPVVVREGVPSSARTVSVAPAAFTAPAAWSDGASVRVTEARQQVSGGQGPGALAGQPQTVFTLEVTNGSTAPLDLNGVVVQATYGAGTTQASPLYDGGTTDFSGTLEPGATATAVYSFAIPADELGEVSLSVDVDGLRFPAAFTGSVPAN
ncbi:hypothetical protein [Modestobacter lapidis]|nr:hypothetical protein [Modestobacter lapidis]